MFLYLVSISHSPSATGVVVYNTFGTNKVTNSEFSYNDMNGGGGFYVEFTFCIPGDENCSDFVDSYTNENHNLVYLFENCLFRKNVGYVSDLGNTTYLAVLTFIQENCSTNIHSDIPNVAFTDSSKIVHAFPGIQFNVPIHIMDDLQKSLGSQSLFSSSLNGHYSLSV